MSLAVVNKNILALKRYPQVDCETVDEVLYGMVPDIIEIKADGWCRIRTHYDYEGYVHKDDLLLDETAAREWQQGDYVIWKLLADVMKEPDYGCCVLATLPRGSRVKYTGVTESKWEKVGLADGSFGWIRRGFARKTVRLSMKENEEQLRKNIVETALEYLGTQYRWGGKSPVGIDCSGLTSMSYMLNGYLLPRDGGPQEKFSQSLSRDQLKPGDLLFFPGHVALYIGGKKYLHSTGREGYVVVNSLDKDSKEYREDLDKDMTSCGTVFGKWA